MNKTLLRTIRVAILTAMLLAWRTPAFAGGLDICAGETLFKPPFENGPFVELLIRHSSGKMTGYDKKTSRMVSGIPGSCYAEQGFGSNPAVKNLVISEPLNGKYSLYVQANESGIYLLQAETLMNQETLTTAISGVVSDGDVQEIEVQYCGGDSVVLSARKKVDVYLLKRELEISLKKGGLEKGIGKELVRDLIHLERALTDGNNTDARRILKEFISKLANRLEYFGINNKKDLETWFKGDFLENPNGVQGVFMKRELFFSDIKNINNNKKRDWFEARSVNIVLEDAKTMLENIKFN
jgi:hypothetical protein